jgi:hypothetical protein
VRREQMHRPVHVEHRVEAHAGAHAGAFHLPLGVHLPDHGIPSERRRRPECERVEPAAIDAASDAEHEHRTRRGFLVGLAAIQELMPEAGVTLRSDEASRMFAKQRKDARPAGMILRQHL